ncbi:PAS domain S-box protein [Sphingomonas sp. PAMC 26621]|uniref:PAS domain S-box protein n=1 Tax=Sphingomonas sp. PAMC 26621 TaxID=1112213 RepID=UPI0002887155|nr:PAS domain S-box protein [Sphingomonas sp. PAMC 26621]
MVGRPKWEKIPGRGTQRGKILRRAFPVFALVLAFDALAEILIGEADAIASLVVHVIVTGVNIAVFAAVIFWSVTRLAAEYAVFLEITYAMESVPIALTTVSGTIRHWSRGCEELYGWSAEQAVGRSKYDLMQSRNADPMRIGPVPGGSDSQQQELIEQRCDGTEVHVIERVRLVQAPGRTAVQVHEMTDITERVRIEVALKESDANLSLALEAQKIGTFELNVATGEVAVSPAMEQRLGLKPGELGTIGAWAERIEPVDMAAIRAKIEDAAIRHAERYSFQYRLTVPNDGVRVIEGVGRLIYDAKNKLSKVFGILVDVTDRNRREVALLVEQEQFRLVLKTVPSAMVIFDDRNIIKAFSASAEQLFGYAAHEVIGCNVEILAVTPNIHKANSFVNRYLKDGKSYVSEGTPVTYASRRDGSAVPIELWMGDMGAGSKRLFTAFARDLTERLHSEKRLSEMSDELLHASRLSAMGEMAAGLAHELNQPLAAAAYFLGAADLILVEDANREEGRSLLRLGIEQALRAGEIIRRIRDFATRESVDMQVGPIRTIISDAVSLAFIGATRYDIELVYNLDPSAEMVLADRVQIAQVFVNLLRNATEAMRKCPLAGRRITIRTKAHADEMVEVSVADTGPGIDPSMLDQLYMPFVSTKRDKGMGVGLSICRRIIETHGGTFDAVNSPAGGAVFCFTLQNPCLTSEIDE